MPLSLTCLPCQSDSRSADCRWTKCQATLGEQVLSRFQDCLSKLDRRRQSDCPRVGLRERLEAILSYVLRFESLAIFHANTHSTLPLPTVQSLCELRLLTEDGLGVTHYLSGCRKHFIVQGGKSRADLSNPVPSGMTKSNILVGIIFIIQTKEGSPRARLGGPKVLLLWYKR